MKKNIFKILALVCYLLAASSSQAMMSALALTHYALIKLKSIRSPKALAIEFVEAQFPYNEEIILLRTTFPGTVKSNSHWIRAQEKINKKLIGLAIYENDKKDEINLLFLVVDPKHRRQGIGKTLIEHIAQTTYCKKISLTSTSNATMFYLSLGFDIQSSEQPMYFHNSNNLKFHKFFL